ARDVAVFLDDLEERAGVGGHGRAVPHLAGVETSLEREVILLPRVGIRPETGETQVPAVVVVRARMELGIAIGELAVGPEGQAPRGLSSEAPRRHGAVLVPPAQRGVAP